MRANTDKIRDPATGWPIFAAAALIAAAALAAYSDSFSGPFFFDDAPAISRNPSIRHLWPIGPVLCPPSDGALTPAGRPMVNLSLAVNYALGGVRVGGYHALNLAIHILAGLTLFGIARRTIKRAAARSTVRRSPPGEGGRAAKYGWAEPPTLFALAIALLWTLHPLQTESVTYVVQRAESLMGLFYLLTLYCFIRYVGARSAFAGASADEEGGGGGRWAGLAVVACLLGAATKEVMATAPVMVFLYDRTFVGGTFREAWRRRRGLHLGLASTWLLLGYLTLHTGDRGGSAGFGLGVGGWNYALTQCRAVVLYLRLSLWPHPLVFDYGTALAAGLAGVWPQALLLAGLLAGTAWSLVRRPVLGFIAAWFFLILAPSSSIVPVVTQTVAEHRMYLPLAAIATLAVIGIQRLGGRQSPILLIVLAAGLGGLTALRNRDYRSETAIWADTVAKFPGNPRAHYNLGLALGQARKPKAAIAQYDEALRLKPDYAQAHNNLALELGGISGRASEAIAHFEAALRLKPGSAEVHSNLAHLLAGIPGRAPEAIAHYEAALRLKPDDAESLNNLGLELAGIPGRLPEAIARYEAALRLKPDYAEAHNNLGLALAGIGGREADAIAQYEAALRLKPDYAEAHFNLANRLTRAAGRAPEAIAHYEAALRLRPGFAEAHNNLAVLYAESGRLNEAIAHYEKAMRLEPNNAEARINLANQLAGVPGRRPEAIAHYEAAVRLKPDLAEAHHNLALLYAESGRLADAIAQYEAALRLKPDLAEAHNNLAVLYARTGRLSEAIGEAETALRLKPSYGDARVNLRLFQALRKR